MFGKIASDLQSGVAIEDHAVSGTLNWVEGYTGFSSNPAEQQGNYIALTVDTEALGEQLDDCVITCHIGENDVVLDSDKTIVIRYTGRVDEISFTAEKEGYTTGVITLDLSTLTLTPEPYKLLNEFASTGLTQSPASTVLSPTGTTYTLTGSVQYLTTYSDNRISYTGNLNKFTEGGTSIEISYGTGNEKVVLLTDTAGTSGGIDVYDGWIIVDSAAITAGTWNIVISDGTDTLLSQTVDVTGLTLAPDPTPRMNITSADQLTTITPATFNTAKTATGQAPYNTTGSYNYIALNLAYTGSWDQNYYKIVAYDDTATQIWDTPVYAGSNNLPTVIGINPITSSNIGTGKYIDITIFSGETAQSQSTAVNTIRIDTNALTLEAAPISQFGVEITGFTYNNITYSLTDILNNSSTATLTATWADNQAATDITGLDIKYNDIKGDGSFVNPIGITFKNGMYNGNELVRCFSAQGSSGIIDGNPYYFPHTYIVDIKNLMDNRDQFSFTCMDADDNAVYLYLNVNNSTLTPQP